MLKSHSENDVTVVFQVLNVVVRTSVARSCEAIVMDAKRTMLRVLVLIFIESTFPQINCFAKSEVLHFKRLS